MPKKNQLSTKSKVLFLIGFLLALFLILAYMRVNTIKNLTIETKTRAIPVVATILVKPGPATEEIILPGNVQAWHEATIYARTSGYIKKWFVDIGSRVKAGDLLALIESPEIDAQLQQAEADLRTAIANEDVFVCS